MKPYIGITMGDAAGIGPEIILKSLDENLYKLCNPLIIGDFETLYNQKENLEDKGKTAKLNLVKICSVSELKACLGQMHFPDFLVFDDFNLNLDEIKIGAINARCGMASILFLKKVVNLIGQKVLDGTVSAPVNKEAANLAGYKFAGQTEFLAKLTGSSEVVPLIIIGNVRIFQLTAHISMRKFLDSLTKEMVLNIIRYSYKSLKEIGIGNPKISIAGLNPHAGENGLLGNEEIEILKPAVDSAKKEGIDVYGPFPVDSLFLRVKSGDFDCIITLYHDQATIAMKLLGTPVTLTLGLPFIRTSVGHGTAFNIAGKGIADGSAFKKSIITCAKVLGNKKLLK